MFMKDASRKLGALKENEKCYVEEMCRQMSLIQVVGFIREERPKGLGIQTCPATLHRFLRKRKEERLKAMRGEMNESVAEAAKGVDRKGFRKGTLALLQQRIYDEAAVTGSLEEAKEAYRMLAEEDAREAQLELDARKAAVAEENARLGRRKLELEEARSALALLPKLTEILMREGAPEGELLREARECLLAQGGSFKAERASG
jgi:hypothetical protein